MMIKDHNSITSSNYVFFSARLLNIFSNKAAPKVPNSISRNLTVYSFFSLSVVLVTPFINKLKPLEDRTILIILFIPWFEIISMVVLKPKIFWLIPASVADADAVNLYVTCAVVANGISAFFINGSLIFINCLKSFPRNSTDCTIFEICVFDYFMLAVKRFSKAFRRLAACLFLNNKSCGKLILLAQVIFNDNLKVTPVSFFTAHLNLSSRESDNYTFAMLNRVI